MIRKINALSLIFCSCLLSTQTNLLAPKSAALSTSHNAPFGGTLETTIKNGEYDQERSIHKTLPLEGNCISKNYYPNNDEHGEIFFFYIKESVALVANADYGFPIDKIESHGIQCVSFAEMTICDPTKKILSHDFSINVIGTDVITTISGEPIDTVIHDTTHSGRTTRIFYSNDGHIIAFSYLIKDNSIIYVACDKEGAISFHDLTG